MYEEHARTSKFHERALHYQTNNQPVKRIGWDQPVSTVSVLYYFDADPSWLYQYSQLQWMWRMIKSDFWGDLI